MQKTKMMLTRITIILEKLQKFKSIMKLCLWYNLLIYTALSKITLLLR